MKIINSYEILMSTSNLKKKKIEISKDNILIIFLFVNHNYLLSF